MQQQHRCQLTAWRRHDRTVEMSKRTISTETHANSRRCECSVALAMRLARRNNNGEPDMP